MHENADTWSDGHGAEETVSDGHDAEETLSVGHDDEGILSDVHDADGNLSTCAVSPDAPSGGLGCARIGCCGLIPVSMLLGCGKW